MQVNYHPKVPGMYVFRDLEPAERWGTFTWQITYVYQHHLVDACLEDATKLVMLAGAMEQEEPRVYFIAGRFGFGLFVGQRVSEEDYQVSLRRTRIGRLGTTATFALSMEAPLLSGTFAARCS